MDSFISVEEARGAIISGLGPLGIETVALTESYGRLLATSIRAPASSPPFDNSARDGFALRWDDLQASRAIEVVAEARAGAPPVASLRPGQAARIMTGAAVPPGADTIIMQEHCEFDPATRRLHISASHAARPGAWIRRAGDFVTKGDAILTAGSRLSPADIGLLASFGETLLPVYRTPRVAILSTGDELVEPHRAPASGQIINSNAYQLAALCQQAGATARISPPIPDDPKQVRDAFDDALRGSDLILSSGGVSVGDYDVTRDVLDALTPTGMDFWKVRVKPGKPLAFGRAAGSGTPIIGLPGNPGSCFVGFHLFVRPALLALQGYPSDKLILRRRRATLTDDITSTPRRREYLSGHFTVSDDHGATFKPAPKQNSGNLALFCGANALGIVEEGVSKLAAGDSIAVDLIAYT